MKDKDENHMSAADIFAALKEETITAQEVASELDILFNDYFSGCSEKNGNKVTIKFLNGQRFELSVKELKKRYKL